MISENDIHNILHVKIRMIEHHKNELKIEVNWRSVKYHKERIRDYEIEINLITQILQYPRSNHVS